MIGENILAEARETIISCLYNVGGNTVFPENCETPEYSVTVEDGVILIPTKFRANDGQQVFIECRLNLAKY